MESLRTRPLRKRKLIFKPNAAWEFHQLIFVVTGGNPFPINVLFPLNSTLKCKTDQKKKQYKDGQANTKSIKFPQPQLCQKKTLKRVTWKTDIIDAPKYKNRSFPIIHEADLMQSKPRDSISTNITLTRQSLLDDITHKSKDKRPTGKTKHKSTTQVYNGIGNNITTKLTT